MKHESEKIADGDVTRILRAILGSAACHLLLLSAFLALGAGPAKGPIRGVVDVLLVRPGGGDRVEAKRSVPHSPAGQSRARGRGDHPLLPAIPIADPHPLREARKTIAEEIPAPRRESTPPREVDSADPAGSASENSGREVPGSSDSIPSPEGRISSVSPAGSPAAGANALGFRISGEDSEAGSGMSLLRKRIQSRMVYPEEAVRRGQEGEVLLRIHIGTGGIPKEIRIARSSGARLLDEAARRGVVRAAPLPEGPGWVEVPIRFRLH